MAEQQYQMSPDAPPIPEALKGPYRTGPLSLYGRAKVELGKKLSPSGEAFTAKGFTPDEFRVQNEVDCATIEARESDALKRESAKAAVYRGGDIVNRFSAMPTAEAEAEMRCVDDAKLCESASLEITDEYRSAILDLVVARRRGLLLPMKFTLGACRLIDKCRGACRRKAAELGQSKLIAQNIIREIRNYAFLTAVANCGGRHPQVAADVAEYWARLFEIYEVQSMADAVEVATRWSTETATTLMVAEVTGLSRSLP